ncbi:unnamed protein product, partial [Rotaria sp. Silwood1]
HIKITDHLHAPNPEETISVEFKSNISSGATISHDPPRRIIHQALLNVNKNDASAVPNYSSAQRTIERKRKKQDLPLSRPTSFNDILIPDALKVTNGGNRFLLYNNEDPDHRMIILSSDDDLDCLSNSENWHCDGTFKTHIYNEIFDVILKHVSQRPRSITIDFEKSVENAVKQNLPMTTISFCFFHFKQNLWRQIQTLGLQQLFVENNDVRHFLKKFGCLALIPEQFVIAEFEKLQTDSPDSINDFIDYYEDNYIGRPIRNNRRRTPRFSISMWNIYARLDQQLPRTNNSSEGWHRAIQYSVRSHPSIYESIKDLKTEQHATLIMAEQLRSGSMKLRRRAKYELIDEQLQQLASSFYIITRDILNIFTLMFLNFLEKSTIFIPLDKKEIYFEQMTINYEKADN